MLIGWLLIGSFATLGAALGLALHSPQGCLLDTSYPPAAAGAGLSMTVKEGTACAVLVRTGRAIVDDLRIVMPPKLGTVTQRGRTGVTYRAMRSMHGSDDFTFELRGRSEQRDFTSMVHVAVTVE